MKNWNIFHFHILDEFNKGLMQKVGGIILLLFPRIFSYWFRVITHCIQTFFTQEAEVYNIQLHVTVTWIAWITITITWYRTITDPAVIWTMVFVDSWTAVTRSNFCQEFWKEISFMLFGRDRAWCIFTKYIWQQVIITIFNYISVNLLLMENKNKNAWGIKLSELNENVLCAIIFSILRLINE